MSLTFQHSFDFKGNFQVADSIGVSTNLRVDDCLEAICQLGCKEVGRKLELMDQGVFVTDVAGLSSAERQQVHEELRAVMDVYGGGCCEI